MRYLLAALCFQWALACATPKVDDATEARYDVVVYGGTSAGVMAAVQTARSGHSVIVVEPGAHLGGLSAGGLGATDIGNKAAIGGLAREFYGRIFRHYAADEAWIWQGRDEYQSRRRDPAEDTMWTFEPHVAEALFTTFLREEGIPLWREARLDLDHGVEMANGRIEALVLEDGRRLRGAMFIDATYEGDLLAGAGVSYRIGREGNDEYGETLDGSQATQAVYHQFRFPVDPYVVEGDAASGLLPGVDPEPPGPDGVGDHRVQAYNFRMCLTDVPENRLPFPKPAGYDARWYELLLRTIRSGQWDALQLSSPMPNRKTDTNNRGPVSTDFIGQNYAYADGDYATRAAIVRAHATYQQGMMWFLSNDPRVPAEIRAEVGEWGLCRDEFLDHGGWPHQIYVREARRMVSDYVMNQGDCQGRRVAEDPVGLAAYTMDSHHVRRYVKDGRVWNEGDVQVGGFPPYPISYRSIVPRRGECTNLLVPVCLSATHIAFGSIRMEPVFMVLAQSAATAACLAIEEGVAVQDVPYPRLAARLLEDGQGLQWGGASRPPARDPARLPGIVLDDGAAELTGRWVPSVSTPGFVGDGYLHDDDTAKGTKRARFLFTIPQAGHYSVRLTWTAHANRSRRVPVRVHHRGGTTDFLVDQRRPPDGADGFQVLGTFSFDPGQGGWLEITNATDDGHVIVDAVQLVFDR